MAYGARLESVLGASPRGFESLILRHRITRLGVPAIAEGEARFLDRAKTRAYVINEGVSAA